MQMNRMDNVILLQEIHRLSDKENDAIFKGYILPRYQVNGTLESKEPVAIMLGGQPGSGKSSLVNIIMAEPDKKNLIGVAADDFRHFHPRYNKILTAYPELAPQIVSPDANS